MKAIILTAKIIIALVLITNGCDHISRPSDLFVIFGALEILVGIFVFYNFVISLVKK